MKKNIKREIMGTVYRYWNYHCFLVTVFLDIFILSKISFDLLQNTTSNSE